MTASDDAEIVALEQRFWQAMKDEDTAAAIALTAEPCIVTGAQGVARIDHAMFARMTDSMQSKLQSFAFSEVVVERPANDVAVIGYKVREELLVDGKPLTLNAADTSTWIRKGGRWLCLVHTESVLGDPFGRDRKSG
jgi:ketosteroid isomerase-like protein